ncbi:unnamed protein product [Ceutorhynchus assimilis]|uniref:SET domain-containing protein n=1 Tax=Ceutorhynchus assimilis TaxID=467358 RepID=A0A9N9MUW6_9CUCU|nr:unnamed protein product [Ceutorhynchus assimilis]
MNQRTANRLNTAINQYLDSRDLLDKNPGWVIQESLVGGLGVFATRDLQPGEVIFRDSPVIIGPRCLPDCSRICASCLSKTPLKQCKNGCGLDLCLNCPSTGHQNQCEFIRKCLPKSVALTEDFRKTLYENYTPITSLFLSEKDKDVIRCLIAHDRDRHGHEIDSLKTIGLQFEKNDEKFMRFVCCAMDANAFEVTVGTNESQTSVRGLYPLGSLANHSCVPNTTHVFDNDQRMIATASKFIEKHSEIFQSYTRLTWGTAARLYHLHITKHFVCKCPRCKDPTEFGTFMGSVLCKLCRGIVSPLNPFKAAARWRCRDCQNVITGKDTGELMTLLGSILKNMASDDFPFMLKFLNGKLKDVVPDDNQVAVELKFKIVWILGHRNGYKWNDLPTELLQIKKTICEDLLQLLEKLRCGQSKMRGLLLYELFCCKREFYNRDNKQITEIQALLHEAALILKYDATANEELKNAWKIDSI